MRIKIRGIMYATYLLCDETSQWKTCLYINVTFNTIIKILAYKNDQHDMIHILI